MELTSGLFLGLLLILTVAAVAGAVLTWPRLAVQQPLFVLGRVGVLIGVNLLVMATVGVIANNTFGFFADWTDLAGAFQSTPTFHQTTHGGNASTAAEAPVGGRPLIRPSRPLPPLPARPLGDREYTFRLTGPVSHVTGQVVVYLPPGYSDRAQANRRYPVIEAFHGYPGIPQQWLDSMALGQVLDSEAAAGRMAPTLVVAPQLEIPPGRDTECVDAGNGHPAMETWLTTDVPDWVARTFRVRLDRGSWAAAGLSAGGWCAAMAALLHPARYGAALVFGGYFAPDFGTKFVPFRSDSPQGRRYNLVALAHAAPPPVALWIETSHSDKVSYTSTAAFLKAVRAPLSVRLVEFGHAGHSIFLWAGVVPTAVQWLETVGGFRSTP